MVIQYRVFNNFDPPVVADLWNACFSEPGAAVVRTATVLEYFTFAKPNFDAEGLLLAVADGRPVGFAHSGFGPGPGGRGIDYTTGVLCAIGVLPDFRRQGIGSALLARSEEYLRRRGAQQLFAGPIAAANPFTFALYGGSQSSGFLDSSVAAKAFFEQRGYRVQETSLVYRAVLDRVPAVVDGRFPAMRQRYDVVLLPHHGLTWYEEAAVGPTEFHDFHLSDKVTGRKVARACLWEMETFAPRWNEHPVGIVELETAGDLRRQGLAKFLMANLLRHLHEQFFTVAEMHVPETNEVANKLMQKLGFVHADTGRRYRRDV
jgi:ribosomal protein S18 acetylase RimI-like enzyme